MLGACDTNSGQPNERGSQAAAVEGFAVVDEDPIDYEACQRISEDV